MEDRTRLLDQIEYTKQQINYHKEQVKALEQLLDSLEQKFSQTYSDTIE